MVSFGFIATYWVNHHYLFQQLKQVNERVLWSNMVLLFLLLADPLRHRLCRRDPRGRVPDRRLRRGDAGRWPGLRAAGASTVRAQIPGRAEPTGFGAGDALTAGAVGLYALAIPAAFFHPTLSLALIFAPYLA